MSSENFQKSVTNRGFNLIKFTDMHNHACSLQESSLATANAVWLGVDGDQAAIMKPPAHGGTDREWRNVSDETITRALGVQPGFFSYPTRMHLNQEQAKELIIHLQRFVDTGQL